MRILIIVGLAFLLLACTSAHEKEDTAKKANVNLRLGVKYLQQGRIDDALEKIQRALKYDPDLPEAHSSLALVYDLMGEVEKAIDHYKTALELSPKSGVIHHNYAELLCRTGKPMEAEQHFLTAIKSRKYNTPELALENLGTCMMRVPDMDKAEKYLRQALQINPKLPRALLKMARVGVEKKRYMSGRAYLQRYLDVAEMSPESLWLGIQVEKQLGDKNAVRNYEQQLRRKFPDSNESKLLLDASTESRAN